jgi:hypothetical protein
MAIARDRRHLGQACLDDPGQRPPRLDPDRQQSPPQQPPAEADVIQGLKGANGTITATSVSDSGAGTTRAPGVAGSNTTPTNAGTVG